MASSQYDLLFCSETLVSDRHLPVQVPTTMKRHGVVALDFATVSGCDQLVIGPTHERGGSLDLLMTDVPDLVWSIRVAGSWILLFCLVVPGWNAASQWDGCISARWIWAFHQPKFACGCCEILVFWVCGARQNFCVFSLYCNPDLDDRIYDCLLTAMAAVQAADARAWFLFVGDFNGYHQEWL